MRKTHYVFDCSEHEEYGGLGWKLANMPAFDPLPGMAVAHDVLEHLPDDDSTTGELMALGAMIHVRGEDYFANKGQRTQSPAENFAGELGDLLLKVDSGEWVPLRSERHTLRGLESWVQDEIRHGIAECKKYLKTDREETTRANWQQVGSWIAHGYRTALRRYRNVNRYQLLDVFNEIEENADKALKHAEAGISQLHVRLVWESGITVDARYAKLKVWVEDNYGDY